MDSNGKEVADMFKQPYAQSFHDDRIRESEARFADAQRREAARAFAMARRESRSIRRAIGRSIVRVGEAIAEDNGQPVASS
jgi:hypothetical protein